MLGGDACRLVAMVLLLAALPLVDPSPSVPTAPPLDPPMFAGFTENVGQLLRDNVRYYSTSPSMQVGFTEGAVLYRMAYPTAPGLIQDTRVREEASGVLVRATFHNGNTVRPEGRRELPGRANYLLGNDPAEWRTGVPVFGEVVYREVWPGVSVVYRARAESVKYSYELQAGGRVDSIAIRYDGADRIGLAGEDLVVTTEQGELRDSPPIAEQDGRPVDCAFRVLDDWTAGLTCPAWDPSRPGVIDPIVWATYVGATGRDDLRSVAVDATGSVFVAGHTGSTDFPTTPGAFRAAYDGGFYDVFVAKFRPGGNALEWATYLGGAAEEYGLSLAVNAGAVYVTGYTSSSDFPTFAAFDPQWNATDAFLAKLAPSGAALVYSTFLGGTGEDAGEALAVGPDGSVTLVGITGSMDFPTTPGAPDRSHNGGLFDAFVARLNPAGNSLAYATYLGGVQIDSAVAVAVDGTGASYVTGGTLSTNFPTTPGAFDRDYNDLGPLPAGDAYLTKFHPAGTAHAYSTFLGGSAADSTWGVRVDAGGRAFVAGYTESPNFPTTAGARNGTYIGGGDAFVAALSPAGNALAVSTFIGGAGVDQAFAIHLDALGRPYVAGSTTSMDFPVTPDAPGPMPRGGRDAFVAHLNASLDAVLFGTYFGGSGHDDLYALGIDPYGHAYLGGLTLSTDLPTTTGAFDRTCGTDGNCNFDGVQSYIDGFLAKVKVATPVTVDITIATVPTGRLVGVDGTPHTAPYTFPCVLGTEHTLEAPSPQVVGTTRYAFDRWSDGGDQSHTFLCEAEATVTASFVTEYEVVVDSRPPGRTIVVDLSPVTAPFSFWWVAGSSHLLDAESPQGSGGTRWIFSMWSDLGPRIHEITVSGPQTFTASFVPEHSTVITSSPVGLTIEVDSVFVKTPFALWCPEGTVHAVNATSPQGSTSVRHLFRSWSDEGAQSHTILCSAPATVAASFDTEYSVTVDSSPSLLQILVDGVPYTAPRTFWCAANSSRQIDTSSPQGNDKTRYAFGSWSDGLPRRHGVLCSAPATFRATFDAEHWVEVDTNPPGLDVIVDGGAKTAPAGFWWRHGSSHTLDASTPQLAVGTRYTFAGWMDGPVGTRTAVVEGPSKYVARFDVEYAVTLETSPPGLRLEVDGAVVTGPFTAWWAHGSAHEVSAPSPQIGEPGVRLLFGSWSDGGDQVRLLRATGPLTHSATFRAQYRLALSSPFGTPTCDVADCWYDPGDTASFGIQTIVNVTPGTRYAFDRWTGSVSQKEASGTAQMDGPKFAVAVWTTEYFLRVESAFGTTAGEGWHPEGARATFSVSPAEVVSNGRRLRFAGWSGDAADASVSASLLMSGSKVVTANWQEVTEVPWLWVALAVVPPLLVIFWWRRRRRDGSPEASESDEAPPGILTSVRTRIRPRR